MIAGSARRADIAAARWLPPPGCGVPPAQGGPDALLRQLTRDGGLAAIVPTHELALRTADVIWLVLPGGEWVVDDPEYVIVSGGIARPSRADSSWFRGEERGG
jgi:hypothetical protein